MKKYLFTAFLMLLLVSTIEAMASFSGDVDIGNPIEMVTTMDIIDMDFTLETIVEQPIYYASSMEGIALKYPMVEEIYINNIEISDFILVKEVLINGVITVATLVNQGLIQKAYDNVSWYTYFANTEVLATGVFRCQM